MKTPSRVVATGIVFEEPHDPAAAYAAADGFLTPEARQAIDAWRAGDALLLTHAAFAEIDDGHGVRRWGGPPQGPHPVPTHGSATATLLGLAVGYGEDLLPALGINGLTISRFDFHAAPRRIELDESIRRRLRLD
ncbi:hypothetical protein [Conexibacter woesei]|uniref:Uncharacterized protein n=1 Tax=Conexibacter woesei (strain DSM 14684 / CCUG 47730 / CIP 108061 / JCM 11494 / NBRC 100937 / ID131577) TaxID=469383 RepID=D3F728_CONWI|nr:hypothetical protein [Conexibacter woesei]ADB48799.1 hypothetical protein Cwoe_0363 [Conexibacter woesei DSM 14684]